MKTEFFVDYDLYDTTALQDAVESTESNSSFADIRKMKEGIPAPSYGTLEHNLFVLDGSMEEFPDNPDDLVYFSKNFIQTNSSYQYCGGEMYAGDDLDGPVDEVYKRQSIEIQFTENHTSYGITLHFLDAYPTEIEVLWYDLFGTLKSRKRFYPDSLVYFCKNQVEEYGRIEIVFLRALPYHNVKLQYIEYGTKITWGSESIKSGKLVNDTDPTSDKIKTDKLTFSFVDAADEFNLGNADGLHRTFQRNQQMFPYEMARGKKIPLGTFFLDNVSTTKNVTKISAIDYKGKLADTDFMSGRMYEGERAGRLIDEIMEAAGIKDYAVDDETADMLLYGTLKVQTCQKALREVLFACGSVINTSHRAGIEIRKNNRIVTAAIPRSRKFSTTYQIDKYVSDVKVKYKTWTLEDKESEITKGAYDTGIHTIQLSNPADNMTASAGLILEQTPYYVVIKVDESSEVIITGQKYVGEELAVQAGIEHIKPGEMRNIKTFSGTLLNFESAKRAAENILDYYGLQQIIKTKHLAEDEKTGGWVEIENTVSDHANFVAAIESLSTDLTGGFISTSKCRGYFKTVTDYYFADDELYADEGMGAVI